MAALALAAATLLAAAPTQPALAAESVAVVYHANGPAGVVYTQVGGMGCTVPDIDLAFEGYTFTGTWSTGRDGSGASYQAGDAVVEGCVLYAQWADGTHLEEGASGAEGDVSAGASGDGAGGSAGSAAASASAGDAQSTTASRGLATTALPLLAFAGKRCALAALLAEGLAAVAVAAAAALALRRRARAGR